MYIYIFFLNKPFSYITDADVTKCSPTAIQAAQIILEQLSFVVLVLLP